MDRLGFLKRIGILAGASLIPADSILTVTDFVEKKAEPVRLDKFVNHMTIQRKTYSITGGEMKKEIYYEFDEKGEFIGKFDYYLNYKTQ